MDSPFIITQIEVLYLLLFVIVKGHIFAFLTLNYKNSTRNRLSCQKTQKTVLNLLLALFVEK